MLVRNNKTNNKIKKGAVMDKPYKKRGIFTHIQIPIGEEDIRMFKELVDDGEPFTWTFDKIDVEFIKDDEEDR